MISLRPFFVFHLPLVLFLNAFKIQIIDFGMMQPVSVSPHLIREKVASLLLDKNGDIASVSEGLKTYLQVSFVAPFHSNNTLGLGE